MRNLPALFFLALLVSPNGLRADEPTVERATGETSREIIIAVADFTGEDAALGRFLADTLLTDLAQSDKLRLVERSELRRAIEELKLEETGLFAPPQARELGQLLRTDRLIVGSYLKQGDHLLINARLLDVETGRLLPGGAVALSGESRYLLNVIHRMAHMLHFRITGEPYVINGEGREPPGAVSVEGEEAPRNPPPPTRPRSEPAPTSPNAAASREKMRAAIRDLQEPSYTRNYPVNNPVAQEKERRSSPLVWPELRLPPPPLDLRLVIPRVITYRPVYRSYPQRSVPIRKSYPPHRRKY